MRPQDDGLKRMLHLETNVRRVLGGIILLACARFLRYKDGESIEKGSGDDSGKAQIDFGWAPHLKMSRASNII